MIELLSRTILMGTPLLYGSLSEVYSERSGVMNTAIEGIFLMGAWAGFVAAYQSGGNLAIGMLAAMGAGLLTAALYGWIAIFLKQQQIVTGVAINILALGICAFFQRVIFGVPVTPLMVEPLQPIAIPFSPRYRLSVRSSSTRTSSPTCSSFWCRWPALCSTGPPSVFPSAPLARIRRRATLPASGSIGCAS